MIVFDEYRMIQKMQFASILKKKAESYRAFCYRLQNTPKVIIADALLENKHVLQLKDITDRRVTVYQCMNQLHTDKEVFVVDNEIYSLNMVIAAALRGERIAVATGSDTDAKFLRVKILEMNPDIAVGLYNAKAMKGITVDPTTLWDQHQVIIYTPTILAGSSYLGQYNSEVEDPDIGNEHMDLGDVDATYGIFLTNTAPPDAAVQMLFRCRKSKKFYICVKDTHLRKKRMSDDIYPSYSSTLMWLDKRDNLYRSINEQEGERDIIHAGLVYGTGELEQNYLQCYASFIQDEEKSRRHYMFYLLLYMRDMGVRFRGLISAITDAEKEEINKTKGELTEFRKEINAKYWEDKAAAPLISHDEYLEIDKKPNKTEADHNKISKYKVMKRYNVPETVITADVLRKAKGHDRHHDNIQIFQRLSGVSDEILQSELDKIYLEHLPKTLKRLLPIRVTTPRPLPELTTDLLDASPTMDRVGMEYCHLTETEYKENMLRCGHAIKLLRLFGHVDFMNLYTSPERESVDPMLIKSYIDDNWTEIAMITKARTRKKISRGSVTIFTGINDETTSLQSINGAAKDILEKSFGMIYSCKGLNLENNPSLGSGTFKKVNGKIVLSVMDPTKIPPSQDVIHETFRRNAIALALARTNTSSRMLSLNVIR